MREINITNPAKCCGYVQGTCRCLEPHQLPCLPGFYHSWAHSMPTDGWDLNASFFSSVSLKQTACQSYFAEHSEHETVTLITHLPRNFTRFLRLQLCRTLVWGQRALASSHFKHRTTFILSCMKSQRAYSSSGSHQGVWRCVNLSNSLLVSSCG